MLAKGVRIGEVMRATEPDFALVEWFTRGNQCVIAGACKLARLLNEALEALVTSLNQRTLADLCLSRSPVGVPHRMRNVRVLEQPGWPE